MKKSVSKSRTQVAMHPEAEVTKVQLQSFKQLHDIFCEEKANEGDIFDDVLSDFSQDSGIELEEKEPPCKHFEKFEMNDNIMVDKEKNIRYELSTNSDGDLQRIESSSGLIVSNQANYMKAQTFRPGSHGKLNNVQAVRTDLIFAFACPMWFNMNNNNKLLKPLNSKGEFDMIDRILSRLRTRKVKYSKIYATQDHLNFTLSLEPSILHFSGHGELGSDKKKDDDFLIIEDNDMVGRKLKKTEIERFFVKKNRNVKLVVILSCHSQTIGEIFSKCGISHVICVDRNEPILDKACLIFTKALYTALFGEANMTI